MVKPENIRNFCIIAHIDHGKTTLSDRLMEFTQTVTQRELQAQMLDAMDLERERGITIKSHPVSLYYKAKDGELYLLNLIDTPGHVDFAYEVSRSLAACEGALLLVDAAQGIEAQTVANAHLAIDQGLEVIPVINKIDLPSADPEAIGKQLEDVLAIPADDAVLTSAKSGLGIEDALEAVVKRVPAPQNFAEEEPTRVLIFDSVFDSYRGVICYVRVVSGKLKQNDGLMFMGTGLRAQAKEVGRFVPSMQAEKEGLSIGCTGYIVTNLKSVADVKIGDTLTHFDNPAKEALPGYKEISPMVFSGLYPLDSGDFTKLKNSLERLQINDAALRFTPESSSALGFGFRCGFLGLLHMEIVGERLRREYDLDLISTYPSVVYKVKTTSGEELKIDNPIALPDASEIDTIAEPTIRATIHIPSTSIGDTLALITEKRGYCDHTETVSDDRVMLKATLPLNEIVVDFNDRLKSLSRGYGSMDYELGDYVVDSLVRMDIMVNGEPVDAFATIVHKDKAEGRGRALCEKLKEILPRQMFKVALQAAIGAKVIARETIGSYRKDVTAKCYGGDITRKKKLLEKQKKGKARMKQIGKVSIPQEAFVQILKQS